MQYIKMAAVIEPYIARHCTKIAALHGKSMDWLKGLLLMAFIFVPLERLLAWHPEQRVFRSGSLNDMIHLLLNGQMTSFWLGFSDVAIGAYIILYGWQSLIHSNVRDNFGPLRWLRASPEFHHWHHSRDREARDKNLAVTLPLHDVLFGTLHMPRGQIPSKYGLDQPNPATYPAQLLYPFRSILTSKTGSH